jgi:peptide/nickel transport system substrate-binding protein
MDYKMKRKNYKTIIAILLLLALTLSLVACGNDQPPPQSPTPTPAEPSNPSAPETPDVENPPAVSETPLRMAWLTAYSTIDPHYVAADSDYTLSSLIYESFYDIDQLGNEYPRLAESYDISGDGTIYTYHLKKGVKWQTGEDFTSADVLYSIERAMDSPFMMEFLGPVSDFHAPDDHTVVFELYGLDPTFHIAVNRIQFLSEAATADLEPGFSSGIPGGTGPYTLESIVLDQKAVFVRNDTYHGSPAPIGRIEVTILSDTNAAVRAMEAGESDYAIVDGDNWERLRATGRFNAYTEDTITVRFFAMNNERAPFDNPLVRQAINYAVDKNDMILGSVGGFGIPASYLANPNMNKGAPQHDEIFQYTYDPDKARELLAEAGYANGLTIEDPILTAATEEFSIPAQILKEQLAAVGIQIEILTVDLSTLVMDMIMGNYGIGALALGLEPDASMIALAYITDMIDALNLSRYSNERVDELFAMGASTMDLSERKAAYREALDIASQEAAYLPLYILQSTVVTTPGLRSTSYQNMYHWYWED